MPFLTPLDLVDDANFDGPLPSEDLAELRTWLRNHDEDDSQRLDFPIWIAFQADVIRASGSERDHWLASQLNRLARRARFLEARTPTEYDERAASLEK